MYPTENTMKIKLDISINTLKKYTDFVGLHQNKKIVQDRRRNLKPSAIDEVTVDDFWRAFLGGILTTQQRSGAGSGLEDLFNTEVCLHSWDWCKRNPQKIVDILKIKRYAIRFPESKATYLITGANFIEENWPALYEKLQGLRSDQVGVAEERAVARYLQSFKGIGPKQSRNMIQHLGLSRYEIPLDSRIVKRLKELGFPVPLSSKALADEEYYCFVEDVLRDILCRVNVLPCIFDACAFGSFEKSAVS